MNRLELLRRMLAHHTKRQREATCQERFEYHMRLANSLRAQIRRGHWPPQEDWRDARTRWCARMRAWDATQWPPKVLYW